MFSDLVYRPKSYNFLSHKGVLDVINLNVMHIFCPLSFKTLENKHYSLKAFRMLQWGKWPI